MTINPSENILDEFMKSSKTRPSMVEVEIKLFFCISCDHMINESLHTMSEIAKVIVRVTELNNKNIYVLQIGARLCYELGRLSLLQIKTNVVTNWGSFIITNWGNCCYKLGSYYKLGQPFLHNRAAITSWSKIYSKLGQVLQIRAIITN